MLALSFDCFELSTDRLGAGPATEPRPIAAIAMKVVSWFGWLRSFAAGLAVTAGLGVIGWVAGSAPVLSYFLAS